MKIKILLLLILLVLFGCENADVRGTTHSGKKSIALLCVDGVESMSGYRGYLAPHFKPDGPLYICQQR